MEKASINSDEFSELGDFLDEESPMGHITNKNQIKKPIQFKSVNIYRIGSMVAASDSEPKNSEGGSSKCIIKKL